MIFFFLSEGVMRWHLVFTELTYLSAKKAGQPDLIAINFYRTVLAVNKNMQVLMLLRDAIPA